MHQQSLYLLAIDENKNNNEPDLQKRAPSAGLPVSFVMMSWLNALYSFDYKWSLSKHLLEHRVRYFETHWAYFTGKFSAARWIRHVIRKDGAEAQLTEALVYCIKLSMTLTFPLLKLGIS